MGIKWAFVADRSRGVVYEVHGHRLKKVEDFDEEAVRAHASELMTGKRGRRADSGANGARSAMDRQTTVQQTEVLRFVDDIAEWFDGAANEQRFDELYVVAGPQMLGELREKWSSLVTERIVDELDKVYTKEPHGDLEDLLRKKFPALMEDAPDSVPAAARQGNAQPIARA